MKLRQTHWSQLCFYLKQARENGVYYGNREQFNKRHIELEKWLFEQVEKSCSEPSEKD